MLCDPDGAPVDVSTRRCSRPSTAQDGVQRRATLELWPDGEDGQPLRGRRHADQRRPRCSRPGLNAEIAFFRWSVEGREGLGHYEVVRADG